MSQGVTKLKELLFESEAQALTDLQRRIETVAKHGSDQRAALSQDLTRLADAEAAFRNEVKGQLDEVFSRAGTEDRFKSSVADVLDRALAEAEVKRHTELSDAVAPLVVSTIKREINESQDELVDALYPITGRLVQSYVASAIRELTERIDRQMTANPTMLWLKSLATGRPVAELALARSQGLRVEEVYLIRRGSGELLARWPETGANTDRDQVMSGILTAINEFSLEAFADEASSLRQIDLNTAQVYLRASPRLLLAAKCSGVANAAVERFIDEEFIATLERRQSHLDEVAESSSPAESAELLSETAENIQARIDAIRRDIQEDNTGWFVLKAMGWLLVLALAAWIAWTGYNIYQTEHVRDRANAVISETHAMRGYPVRLSVTDYGKEISLAGLAPTSAAKNEIISRLQNELSGVKVNNELTVVPTTPDARPQVADLRRQLDALPRRLERQSFDRSTERTIRRLSALPADLKHLELIIDDQSARTIANSARATVATVRNELEGLRELAASTDGTIDNQELSRRVAQLRMQIAATNEQLATLLDPQAAGARTTMPNTSENLNLMSETEALAVQTEQFATLTIALVQAASVKPPPSIPTPSERLEEWIGSHAIFFSSDSNFKNPEMTARHLDELARLMKASGANLRIVGFTDEKGTSRQNSPLAQDRAEAVEAELVRRGVNPDRMVAIGRHDLKYISSIVGDSSPNRRVEFELAFVGETLE